ncbi:MAG: YdeI/OmpD-associated family protein [Bacteroidetes bacterium]|nr:YdeI/OmpD-associated family protein [Bacteroidota bacterium]
MLSSEQINLYIAGHPEWQRKLMVRLRQLIHGTDGDVEEVWRGQAPHFDLAGQPLLNITATKTTVCIHFPKGAQFKSTRLPYEACSEDKPGRSVKLREGETFSEAGFTSLVNKAAAINEKQAGTSGKHTAITELESVLHKDPSAWANWESFDEEARKEYSEWITDGRKEETRKRRIAQAFEMIREGLLREEEEKRVKGS